MDTFRAMERNPSPAYALPTRAFPVPVLLRSAALAALSLSCFGPRPTAAEDFSSWPRHVDFRIDTSPSGADVAGEVRDFPLRIRLDKSILAFSETRRRGSDLRFSKPDGTPLPYQIDTWDSAAGVAEAWVKLDRVLGGTRDQFVRMYWGKPDARDGSNAAAVFDSAQGYVGAWHLGGSGPRANAVAGGASAAPSPASVPQSRPGVSGAADSLTGESAHAYLDLGNGYSDFSAGFTFSVS